MPVCIVLFRRDLRLQDNTALNEAFRTGLPVLPLFVVDATLLDRWAAADKRLAFYYQSVAALEASIADRGGRLLVRHGDPVRELASVIDELPVSRVFVNREYTPFGRRRDSEMEAACLEKGVAFHALDDAVLNAPGVVRKKDGGPYTVFTPYYRKASDLPVAEPSTLAGEFLSLAGPALREVPAITSCLERKRAFEVTPGRAGAEAGLARLPCLVDYDAMRDVPAARQTSMMSAHLRFGTCSPREFHAVARDSLPASHPLVRQLYWRDFYTQVAWHFPHVFGGAFRRVYDGIDWQVNDEALALWKAGRTGFPIVDAGMRELARTGLMHNRVRMVVASFLTKNLHIDWREGEAHFARHLIDYDPAVNNGNWQWGASTGCDVQPYFRVFNPWRQQQKFDRDCVYIRQWVEELEPYPARTIHRLEREGDFYLPQITDLRRSSESIKQAFKAVSS